MTSSAHGYFVWHDLITTDIPAAVDFYKKVVGWTTQPFDPEGKYLMWSNKTGPVGGIGSADAGKTPGWRPYIGTDDIDATIALAEKLGGEVLTPPTDISNGGKWAVLKDPQGNEFGLYWSADNPRPELKMQPGEFHWHELATDDYKSAFEFYQQLFGWQPGREHSMGEIGTYALFVNEGRPQGMGGFYNKQAGTTGGWCTYTIVKDVKKAAALISKLGGKNTHEPIKVPGGSWVIKFTDAQGALHALTSESAGEQSAEQKTRPKAKASAAKPKAKAAASKSATTAVKKAVKKKAAKKPATKKVAEKKAKAGKKDMRKTRTKDEKQQKKELKKQKKLEKKLRKKEKKEKKKQEKAKRKK